MKGQLSMDQWQKSPNFYQSVYSKNHPLVMLFLVVALGSVVLHRLLSMASLYTCQRGIPHQLTVESPGVFIQMGIPSLKSSPINHANRTQEVYILSWASDHVDPQKTTVVDGTLLTYFISPAFSFLLAAALVHMLSLATTIAVNWSLSYFLYYNKYTLNKFRSDSVRSFVKPYDRSLFPRG